jgi:Protein of unknown function (DUF1573)/HYDIN/CFA65/VesB-like, Ig-like domain
MSNPLLLALLAVTVVFTFSETQAQLKILDGDEISFGQIYQTGEKVHKTITIRNVGDKQIAITRVGTSCGCTAAIVSDSILNPGDQTEIKIEFNPFGYFGKITKYIYIANSDPNDQLVTARLTGYVVYALQPTPSTATFGQMKVGATDSSSVTLSNTSEETIHITGVEIPDSDITYRLDRQDLKPGEFTDLHLYLKLTEARSISCFIRVSSTSKLEPVLQIRVFGGGYIFRRD